MVLVEVVAAAAADDPVPAGQEMVNEVAVVSGRLHDLGMEGIERAGAGGRGGEAVGGGQSCSGRR